MKPLYPERHINLNFSDPDWQPIPRIINEFTVNSPKWTYHDTDTYNLPNPQQPNTLELNLFTEKKIGTNCVIPMDNTIPQLCEGTSLCSFYIKASPYIKNIFFYIRNSFTGECCTTAAISSFFINNKCVSAVADYTTNYSDDNHYVTHGDCISYNYIIESNIKLQKEWFSVDIRCGSNNTTSIILLDAIVNMKFYFEPYPKKLNISNEQEQT